MICLFDKKVNRTMDSVLPSEKEETEGRLPLRQRLSHDSRIAFRTVVMGGDKEYFIPPYRKYPEQAEKSCK